MAAQMVDFDPLRHPPQQVLEPGRLGRKAEAAFGQQRIAGVQHRILAESAGPQHQPGRPARCRA
jgi:hypothetical protein